MTALIAGLAQVGTYLYGRRMYRTMAVWETDPAAAEQSPESAAFAATWQAADKVVFSSTSARVHTRRTRLERQLDARVVVEIKAASRGDPTIGVPTLAAEALRLELVDVVEPTLSRAHEVDHRARGDGFVPHVETTRPQRAEHDRGRLDVRLAAKAMMGERAGSAGPGGELHPRGPPTSPGSSPSTAGRNGGCGPVTEENR